MLNDGDNIEDEKAFVIAANLGLRYINRMLPKVENYTLTLPITDPTINGIEVNEDYIIIDLALVLPNYINIEGNVTDLTGYGYSDITVSNNKVYILNDGRKKVISFNYRRKLTDGTLEDYVGNADIDIDYDYEDLLPYITSYYIWLEDVPDKAVRYLNMFSAMVAEALRHRKEMQQEYVINNNGW